MISSAVSMKSGSKETTRSKFDWSIARSSYRRRLRSGCFTPAARGSGSVRKPSVAKRSPWNRPGGGRDAFAMDAAGRDELGREDDHHVRVVVVEGRHQVVGIAPLSELDVSGA